jgi:hypothetical protein
MEAGSNDARTSLHGGRMTLLKLLSRRPEFQTYLLYFQDVRSTDQTVAL